MYQINPTKTEVRLYTAFMNPSDSKIGLALGGGSTLGYAHLGVLRALVEREIPIACISGTSAGSLVAACFAFGMPIEKMIEISKDLNWKKFSRFGYSKLGVNTNLPMAEFITDLLGDVNIEDAKIPLAIIATDIETYEKVVLRTGSLRDAIRASTCLPGFFAPVEVNGRLLVDGGLVENVPLSPLVDMGATITIGVNLPFSSVRTRPQNVIDVLNNSIGVLLRQNVSNLSAADILIQPDTSSFDSSKFKDVDHIYAEGYAAGMRAIPLIREKLRAHTPKKGFMARIRSVFGK